MVSCTSLMVRRDVMSLMVRSGVMSLMVRSGVMSLMVRVVSLHIGLQTIMVASSKLINLTTPINNLICYSTVWVYRSICCLSLVFLLVF